MRFRLTIISCFLFSLSYAQIIVTGKIQDATTGNAIPSARLYYDTQNLFLEGYWSWSERSQKCYRMITNPKIGIKFYR